MNTFKIILLISTLTGLLVIVGYMLGRRKGIVIALVLSGGDKQKLCLGR